MAGLGKRSDGRQHGALRVQLVGELAEQRAEVRIALAALGDPPLESPAEQTEADSANSLVSRLLLAIGARA